MRKMKNVVNNYTPAQVKVREATSNDPWGPSSSVMSEIADLTYNVVAFSEIMTMIWKRLNDHGKNWRHVYKALMLLEYIIKTGSERVAQQCKENIFAIQTLKDFQFADRDNKDQGMNVREKSKNLVLLLKDDDRLKTERERALKAKERFAQASQGIGSDKAPGDTTDTATGAVAVAAPASQNGMRADKTLPNSKTVKERNNTKKKTMKYTEGSKSSHQNKRSKTVKEKKKADEKPKEEGIVTSTGAIMVPVSQQFWWKSGPDSDDGNSDFDDEMLSASSGTPPIQRDPSSEIEQARPQTTGEEELQLQLALAMSREEADEKKKLERSDDVRLQMAITESVGEDGKPIVASTLLNLAEPNQQTSPAKADPWGMPTAAPVVSDPWGASPVSDPAAASMPAIPHDPWGSQPNPAVPPPAPASDPWAPQLGGLPPQVGELPPHMGGMPPQVGGMPLQVGGLPPDPWGSQPNPAVPPPAPANDPWGPTTQPSDPWGATKPADPDEEFDNLRAASPSNMNAAFGIPQNQQQQQAGDAFNMSGMSGALDQNQQQKKKSPKDFLGENSSLVNLDSLIAPAPQPTAAPANPFLGITTTTSTGTAARANPFHQQRTPAPTINQIMSQPGSTMNMGGGMQTGIGIGGMGTSLPQPLMPMNTTPLIPQSQPPQQQTNNPFLM